MSRLPRRSGRRVALGWTLACSAGVLSGCEGLLDVELPGQITAESLYDPSQATILVNSAISDFECTFSEFAASNAAGNEDVYMRVTGWWAAFAEYEATVGGGACNDSDFGYGWWSSLQAGRYQAEQAYQRISEWTAEEVGPNREQLLAQAAIYAGLSYELLGEHFCEVAVDAGPLMSPDETLGVAEEWITTALGHIGSTGDFEVPHGIAPSAEQMTYLIRARIRLARGNTSGASEDAGRIEQGFQAYATRGGGGERTRWNRIVNAHNANHWGTVLGPIGGEAWGGEGWPDVIPYTGYRNLGVLPDGRAISDDQFPITTTDAPTAVADSRVPVVEEGAFNDFPAWTQQKYLTLEDDIALANWEEAWLILAEIEGGQGAIDRVNDIRAVHGLPLVTYLSAGDAEAIEEMIIEEQRRSLFLEGRFWSTKLRKDLWFPRGVGVTPYGLTYGSGVRMVMEESEFDLNPNFDLAAQGTLCGDESPGRGADIGPA